MHQLALAYIMCMYIHKYTYLRDILCINVFMYPYMYMYEYMLHECIHIGII